MKDHFESLFGSHLAADVPVRMIRTPYHITSEEIRRALVQIPVHKAAASLAAPAAVYRACALSLSSWLSNKLHIQWSDGFLLVPHRLKDSELILLDKPGKSGDEVSHWRPIGLQHPMGKGVLTALLRCVRSTLDRPQFAYVPHRST